MKKSNIVLIGAIAAAFTVVISFAFSERINNDRPHQHNWFSDANSFKSGAKIQGNGSEMTMIAKDLNIFDTISIGGNFDVTIVAGKSALSLTLDKNLFPYIEHHIANGHLEVKFKKGYSISPSKTPKLIIYTPVLSEINIGGANKITALNFNLTKLSINAGGSTTAEISGAIENLQINNGGSAKFKVTNNHAHQITLNVGGNSSLILKGKTELFSVYSAGNTDVNAQNLMANHVQLKLAGLGNMLVHADKSLDVSGIGINSIKYYGSPKSVTKRFFGKTILTQIEK